MRMTRILTGLVWGVGCLAVHGMERSVDETKSVAAKGFVTVSVVRGQVDVSGWDRNEVRVVGELDEQAIEFVFDVRGDDTDIAVRLPRNVRGSGYSDLTIYLPEQSRLTARGVSTEFQVEAIDGGVDVRSVSGEVRAREVARRIRLNSVSGDIYLRDANGDIHAQSVSGDVDVSDVAGEVSLQSVSGSLLGVSTGPELDAETVSGDIEMSVREFSQVSGNSVSGDVEVSGRLVGGGSLDIETVSGSVDLQLDAQVDARFDIETGSGGRIRNRLTGDEPRVSKYSRESLLRFVMGEGNGEVVVNTRSGRVTLASQ